MRSGDCE
jgi:hypothetical protein